MEMERKQTKREINTTERNSTFLIKEGHSWNMVGNICRAEHTAAAVSVTHNLKRGKAAGSSSP